MTHDVKSKLSSGKETLDSYLSGGYEKGTVSLIAARPGIGLSRWLLGSTFETSLSGNNALFITLQTTIQDSIEHLLFLYGIKKLKEHKKNNFHILEFDDAGMRHIESAIVLNKIENDIQIVFIDSLDYLISSTNQLVENIEEHTAIISDLSKLAKKHSVKIVIGKHLDEEVDLREDKRPLLSDVEMVIHHEQIANIIGLYRDELYHEETSTPNTLEVRLLKNETEYEIKKYEEKFSRKKHS